jgi:hypothetical protein
MDREFEDREKRVASCAATSKLQLDATMQPSLRTRLPDLRLEDVHKAREPSLQAGVEKTREQDPGKGRLKCDKSRV